MGSYGSQSVASIGALMAAEAELKAAKLAELNEQIEKQKYLIAVYLPKDLIEREVNQSFELVEEDLKTIHEACVKALTCLNAWSHLGESS